MADLDHAHDFISISMSKEAIIRLQRYIEADSKPDRKATNLARILAADGCRSTAAFIGGDIVILERDDAIKMREAFNKLPEAEKKIDGLERDLALRVELCKSLQKKKSKKKGNKKRKVSKP
jgi:hypothetical protein